MTNLQALEHSVNYPVPGPKVEKCLIDRGISPTGDYTGNYRSFDLARADLLGVIVTSPNVSEGGYSISISEKESLVKLADSIYQKHNEPSPFGATIKDASDRW